MSPEQQPRTVDLGTTRRATEMEQVAVREWVIAQGMALALAAERDALQQLVDQQDAEIAGFKRQIEEHVCRAIRPVPDIAPDADEMGA